MPGLGQAEQYGTLNNLHTNIDRITYSKLFLLYMENYDLAIQSRKFAKVGDSISSWVRR
jgi:hypothetical protein